MKKEYSDSYRHYNYPLQLLRAAVVDKQFLAKLRLKRLIQYRFNGNIGLTAMVLRNLKIENITDGTGEDVGESVFQGPCFLTGVGQRPAAYDKTVIIHIPAGAGNKDPHSHLTPGSGRHIRQISRILA